MRAGESMMRLKSWILSGLNRQSVEHVARTAVAATVALLVARALRLPEAYWAAITTVIVLQSTLGAALTISVQRFVGTALGVAAGAWLATHFSLSLIAFGAGLLGVGLVCSVLHIDRTAYRFAGITLALVMLAPHATPPWVTAAHRFVEVSLGIVVGLVFAALWREHAGATPQTTAGAPRRPPGGRAMPLVTGGAGAPRCRARCARDRRR
jgi:uncharacterized membrane protein YccC